MEQVAFDSIGRTSTSDFGQRMVQGEQDTLTRGAAAGANGTLAYVGTFSGEIELASSTLTNPGQSDTDVFVVLMNPAP
jgi:hypothetical protein